MKEKWNQFREWMKKVKKQAVITLAALIIVCVTVVAGIMVQTKDSKTQAQEENQVAVVTEKEEEKTVTPAVDTQDEEPEKAEEEQEAEEKDAQKAEKEEAEEPVAEKERAKKQPEKQEAKANKETSSKTTSKVQTTEKKTSSSSSKKQNSQSSASSSSNTKKPSNNSSGSTASASKPSKPAHTHNWEAQYKKEKGWVDTSYDKVTEIMRCSTCHENVTGHEGEHVKKHALAGEAAGGTYSDTITEHVEDGHWDSQKVLTGYKCSCGATK